MQSTIILALSTVVLLVAGYWILIAIINLLKQFIDHSRGALKSIFVILGVIAMIWIAVNQDRSEPILQHVKKWGADIETVDLFDF